jgi:hypothetical protein
MFIKYNAMKLNYPFLLLFTLSISGFGFAQDSPERVDEKLRGYYSFSGGVSSFPGYCIGLEVGASKRKNIFSVIINYNSQYGNRAPGFFTRYVRYNDKFTEIVLNYGRKFQKKKFVYHIDGGPALFFYADKHLGTSNGYLTTNITESDRTTSVGLSVQTGIDYNFSKKIALGLKANTNLNANYLIFGAQARLMVYLN